MLWEELRQDQFKDAIKDARGVCILPIGCVEAHGIHLPLGCDVMHVYEISKRAAERECVVVFPPLYFGEKSGAGEFPGTIIFPETLIHSILEQCCKEIYRNGFNKILIVNGHGGNTAMLQNFARSILQTRTNYRVFVTAEELGNSMPKAILNNIEKYPYLTDEDVDILRDYVMHNKSGGHGCFTETGWMYSTRPDLVRLDLMNERNGVNTHRFDGFNEHKIYTPFGWMANFPDSLSGEYHEGMNDRIAKAMTDRAVERLADAFKFLKEETISEEYYKEWAAKNPLL